MNGNEVVITGIGLISSLGEGIAAHQVLFNPETKPIYDQISSAPYPIHPLRSIDYDRIIPKKSDQKQMGVGQRLGVAAAGLALQDGGIIDNADLLAKTHLHVAMGGSERDVAIDESIMSELRAQNQFEPYLNERFSRDLRPTLFLTQLPNLLAGNISIVLGVTGSSRTFMGEEIAGMDAVATMAARIRSGSIDIGLAGGASAATDDPNQLLFGFGGSLWNGEPADVWSRKEKGGGLIRSSVAAFLLMESRRHAEARGAKISAVMNATESGYCSRENDTFEQSLESSWQKIEASMDDRPIGILSGATGVEPVTFQELKFLNKIGMKREIYIRATGSMVGHSLEATLPTNIALAALALRENQFFPPFNFNAVENSALHAPSQILVTNCGFWRGEGMITLSRTTAVM